MCVLLMNAKMQLSEAFNKGYAIARWTLTGLQEWRYFEHTVKSDSLKTVAEMIQLDNTSVMAVNLTCCKNTTNDIR